VESRGLGDVYKRQVLACGEMVQSGRSLKQEPPEMI
ncbi:hypothetical protein ACX3VG_25170, partial [Escherichia coli]